IDHEADADRLLAARAVVELALARFGSMPIRDGCRVHCLTPACNEAVDSPFTVVGRLTPTSSKSARYDFALASNVNVPRTRLRPRRPIAIRVGSCVRATDIAFASAVELPEGTR